MYIFLDLWVWFPRGFNVDCFGIFCVEIDFEWVSQLGLSWFGEEHKDWSSCSGLEVSGFDIFLGWFSHVGLGLMIFHVLEVSVEDRDFIRNFALFCVWLCSCSGFDCSWIREEHERTCSCVLTSWKIMKSIIIIIIILDLKVCFFNLNLTWLFLIQKMLTCHLKNVKYNLLLLFY